MYCTVTLSSSGLVFFCVYMRLLSFCPGVMSFLHSRSGLRFSCVEVSYSIMYCCKWSQLCCKYWLCFDRLWVLVLCWQAVGVLMMYMLTSCVCVDGVLQSYVSGCTLVVCWQTMGFGGVLISCKCWWVLTSCECWWCWQAVNVGGVLTNCVLVVC